MKKLLALIVVTILVLAGCAKSEDPFQPSSNLVITNTFPTVGDPTDVEIMNDHLIVAQGQGGFSVYNLSDASLLENVTDFETIDFYDTKEITTIPEANLFLVYDRKYFDAASSKTVYFALEDGELHLTDSSTVSNLSIPDFNFYSTSIEGDKVNFNGYWLNKSSGRYKFYFEQGYFNHIGEENSPYTYSQIELATDDISELDGRTVNNFQLIDDVLYAAVGIFGISISKLEIVEDDGSLFEDFEHLFEIDTPGEALDFTKVGDYLYVADRHAGLQVIKLNNETSEAPELLEDSNFDTTGHWKSVDSNDDMLVALSSGTGLYVFGLDNPEKPNLIGSISVDEIGYSNEVKIIDGKIYVSSRDNGVLEIELKK